MTRVALGYPQLCKCTIIIVTLTHYTDILSPLQFLFQLQQFLHILLVGPSGFELFTTLYFFLPSEAVVKYSLTTEFLSNSLSFRMLLICMLMFGFEVAKSSAICNWLSGHTFQLMRSTLWFTANVRINEREISSLLEYFSLRVQVYSRFTANVRINSELSSTT